MNKNPGAEDVKPVQSPEQAGAGLNVLIIDDEKSFTEELREFLNKTGYRCLEAGNGREGYRILKEEPIDLLILDVLLPGMNGLEILKEIKLWYPDIEVIIISGHGNMDTVISAMRLGAIDYLRKPFRHTDIQIAIERTRKFMLLQEKLKQMQEKYSLISKTLEVTIERKFIGVSRQIREVFDKAMSAAEYPDANVLITGESGTGKENIARIIHYSSPRKDHVFYAINSSAVTDSLLESEFFGHKKGSFTGAISDKMGYFEVCHKGTLFLDEISDMPLNLQAKILRAAEEKKITRIGDTREIYSDFRIISATNHDIDKLIRENKFRLDLLHRLNTLHIHIPPLRERPEDIEPLLLHFAGEFARKYNKPGFRIDPDVIEMLSGYEFPGNVRELRNMTERAFILCRSNTLSRNEFPVKPGMMAVKGAVPDAFNLRRMEYDLLSQALQSNDFNQKATAEMLGISRDALIRKLKKFGISIKRTRDQ